MLRQALARCVAGMYPLQALAAEPGATGEVRPAAPASDGIRAGSTPRGGRTRAPARQLAGHLVPRLEQLVTIVGGVGLVALQ